MPTLLSSLLSSPKRRLLAIAAGLLLVDGLFFSLVNPATSPALVLVLGFGLLAASIYVGLQALRLTLGSIIPLPQTVQNKIVVVTTLVTSTLLALQSINQLTPRDIFAIGLFVAVGLFYLSYANKKTGRK